MARAQALSEAAVGLTEPNPRVGCVITSEDGRVLGEGHTQPAGQAHAEVMALRDAAARGHDVRGATAYVTLEPCAHHGRTPPCCDALVAAGVGKVVVAAGDPNPLVNGQGLSRLRAAGITVVDSPAEATAAVEALNLGFFHRMRTGRSWVRLKVAASLDGRTALENGVSQWITSPEARRDGHAWRRRAGTLLTGVGTVLADDPRLDVRLVDTPRQPLRAVVDARLDTPPSARLFEVDGPLVFYVADPTPERRAAIADRGAEIVALPSAGGASGRVDLAAVIADLSRRPINELHVEAGPRLNGSLIAADLVDECLVYLAPMLLGQGRGLAALPPLQALDGAWRYAFHDQTRVGDDLRLLLRRRTATPT
ncbi:bifunctional diaminohydroxyphosphoribosylaminopyrimidine deaminase/5-amino-6-(5-phosphoribosylamino)uracil reductase RibD [Ideonella sp. NS12-5]|uniref:Riboflavin biosynthesis protein RibD n=2 Tax=Ideonella oryzae TaxID=2937441 RepID=A0ABT1BJZ8_9BURK|nr:bifunctional diaminohydroxyphosphoribosylaminopyrimidine deaminase/5-amino-6-(5-phosphoribosylamino)uracil reductase RibD [Ideonella oryzae]MCO5975941.1 bifunctional diaminohydroxyphosphoribosylaminopyrimidine deaminase/5-amino-6-(5-phosphoribosylamino)uracil reductase RibD [Ideonella oryzae]